MGRLKRMPGRLGELPTRLPGAIRETMADRARRRSRTEPWLKWYKTTRWKRLRWSVLKRDLFTCAECGAIESNTSRLVCDHVTDHKGDEVAFWAGPFQTLCIRCHGAKARTPAGMW